MSTRRSRSEIIHEALNLIDLNGSLKQTIVEAIIGSQNRFNIIRNLEYHGHIIISSNRPKMVSLTQKGRNTLHILDQSKEIEQDAFQ